MIGDPSPVLRNEPLQPPRFDAHASASAQPVEPIHLDAEPVHKRMVVGWLRRLDSLSGHFGTQTRALAIVIVIGLITGAAAGVLMVNARTNQQPARPNTVVGEEVSAISDPEAQKLDSFAAALDGAKVSAVTPVISRSRKARGRSWSSRPRAYRVAIIR